MRVDLLNPVYWPEVRRGSERFVHDLAVELAQLGHAPRLLVGHAGGPRRSVEDDVEVVRVPRVADALVRARGFQPHATHVPLSWAALHVGRPDVAHAFYPTDAGATVRWARHTGQPCVFTLMGVPTRSTLSNFRGRLRGLERATRDSDAVLVLSEEARAATRRWLGVEAEVISPGVDLDAFAPGATRDPEPTIACAADVSEPRKRVGLLLAAFGLVRRERPTARLLLFDPGSPAARAPYEARGVEWLPPGSTDVAGAFGRAWVSGLTSAHEAFGLVLVESLACGTPVFGAREGGVPEIVDRPEIGRLFTGREPAGVARAMLEALELAEDPATALACRARAAGFSSRRTAERHAALYARLLAG